MAEHTSSTFIGAFIVTADSWSLLTSFVVCGVAGTGGKRAPAPVRKHGLLIMPTFPPPRLPPVGGGKGPMLD